MGQRVRELVQGLKVMFCTETVVLRVPHLQRSFTYHVTLCAKYMLGCLWEIVVGCEDQHRLELGTCLGSEAALRNQLLFLL